MRDKLGRFVKGHKVLPSWGLQKGHKLGIGNQYAKEMPPNKTSFKKGYHSRTEFKKGHPYGKRFKKGKEHPYWKGGVKKSSENYILIYMPSHPRADNCGYIKRANLVMEKMLGRYLIPPEMVHHKNEIRNDDRPINLQLFPNKSEHQKYHIFLIKKSR